MLWSSMATFRFGFTELGFKATSNLLAVARELKYKPLDKQEWLRLGVNPPNLEKGASSNANFCSG